MYKQKKVVKGKNEVTVDGAHMFVLDMDDLRRYNWRII